MNENTQLPEYNAESVEQSVYRTGTTEPPKSRKGIFAFLLGTGIFLCGLLSALGLMNIRITHQLSTLQSPESCTVAFSPGEIRRGTDLLCQVLGFSGQTVPAFWQRYQQLPSGVYITQVDTNREAAGLGICAGDILLAMDGHKIPTREALERYLCNRSQEGPVLLTFYRKGQLFQHWLTPSN